MKTSNRILATTAFAVFVLHGFVFSRQQWDGVQNSTGDIHRTGNVGIGTANPMEKLHIEDGNIAFRYPTNPANQQLLYFQKTVTGNNTNSSGYKFSWRNDDGSHRSSVLEFDRNGQVYFRGGNIGIGTANPMEKLHIEDGNIAFRDPSNPTNQRLLYFNITGTGNNSRGYKFSWRNDDGSHRTSVLELDRNGQVYFRGGNVGVGTANPQSQLHVNGTTTTSVLTITGGADLSEQFHISEESDSIEAGMVVSIDAENPGKLVASKDAYDRKVAGIVSGAGGVETGLLMGQTGSIADGSTPVALTGRVYCWADASYSPIQPGDLLTTSDTFGHAMKVVEYTKAQGAIIGKAMSSLEKGKGLVLVLVSLQ